MRKIKSGMTVKVIAGGNKGKIGKVLRVMDDKVIVEGVNVVKKFVRKGLLGKDVAGSMVDIEKPIHISNVAETEAVVAEKVEKTEKTSAKVVKKEPVKKETKKTTKKKLDKKSE